MARRLVKTDFKSVDSTDWCLEIWDLAVSSSNLDYVVEMNVPGFQISWSGDESSNLNPFSASGCSFTLSLTEEQRGAIMSRVYGSSEFSLAVKILKAGAAYWVGQIHPEETIETIEDGYITVDFTASDGLAQLDNIDFKETNGDIYTEKYSAASYVQKILMKIPTNALWYTDSGVGSVFMYEHFLNRPVIEGDSFVFSHTGSDSVTRGVLDYLHLDPVTWYLKDKGDGVVGNDFRRYPTTKKDGFVSCMDVLKDIMTSIGATMCFSKGTWRIFDRCYLDATTTSLESAQVIQYARKQDGTLEAGIYQESIDVNIDSTTSEFNQGIVRRGLQPFLGASQVHKNSGSDLMFGSGVGYSPQNNPVYRFEADNDTFPTSDTDNPSGIHNLAGTSPVSPSMTYTGLAIPNGNDNGVIRLHLSGNCDYNTVNNLAGSLAILSFRLQLTDSDGIDYRLSRRVRTLRYSSQGNAFGVNIVGSNNDYYPKFYDSDYYEWVASTDANYGEAQVDLMLGADPSLLRVDDTGQTQQFLTEDFPSLSFNTPPSTKLDPDNDLGNVLLIDDDVSKRRFVYRFDHELSTPNASSTITGTTMDSMWLTEWRPNAGPSLFYDSAGNSLSPGTDLSVPTYRTESKPSASDGQYLATFDYKPATIDLFQLSGIEFFNGDGTTSFDNRTVFIPTNTFGGEIFQLEETKLGGSFTNIGTHVQGRYLASSFGDPASREDNFKMTTAWDDTDIAARMNERTTKNLMQIRDKTRQIVEGSMFSYATNSAIIEPWQRLVTSKLSGGSEIFIPYRLSLDFSDLNQKVTMMKVKATAPTISGDFDSVDQGKGGSAATGGGKPFGDVAAVFGKTLSISGDLVGLESEVGVLDTAVDGLSATVADIGKIIKATVGGGGQGVYTDENKGTTSSYMGLTSTSAKLQAGTGNTSLDLAENSPGSITMKVQVGASGSEVSATAIDIQGQTGSQLPDIIFSGNVSGIDIGDLDDVSSTTPNTNEVLTWSGTEWAPAVGGGGNDFTYVNTSEIRTDTDLTIKLDYDNNGTDNEFKIVDGSGATIFGITESGTTTGLLTTATPVTFMSSATYQQGAAAVAIVTNWDTTATYKAELYLNNTLQGVTITEAPGGGGFTFNTPPVIATGWEFRVYTSKPGFLKSAVSVSTFDTTASTTFSYWRLQAVDSGGNNTSDRIFLLDVEFREGQNRTGVEYPTSHLTSTTGGGLSVSSGYEHSATYANWRAFNSSTTDGFWTLSNSVAANNWLQVQLTGGAVNIQSIYIKSNTLYHDAYGIKVLGSNTGSFSGEEVDIITIVGNDSTSFTITNN